MPIGVGILLGTLLAFALQPALRAAEASARCDVVALTIVIGTVLMLAGTLGGFGWLLVSKGTALTHEWIASLGPEGQAGPCLTPSAG